MKFRRHSGAGPRSVFIGTTVPFSIPTLADPSSAGRDISTELSASGLAMRDNTPSSLSGAIHSVQLLKTSSAFLRTLNTSFLTAIPYPFLCNWKIIKIKLEIGQNWVTISYHVIFRTSPYYDCSSIFMIFSKITVLAFDDINSIYRDRFNWGVPLKILNITIYHQRTMEKLSLL